LARREPSAAAPPAGRFLAVESDRKDGGTKTSRKAIRVYIERQALTRSRLLRSARRPSAGKDAELRSGAKSKRMRRQTQIHANFWPIRNRLKATGRDHSSEEIAIQQG
jgi:hypothetical protein